MVPACKGVSSTATRITPTRASMIWAIVSDDAWCQAAVKSGLPEAAPAEMSSHT